MCLRYASVIWLLFLTGHLYLIGVWFSNGACAIPPFGCSSHLVSILPLLRLGGLGSSHLLPSS